MVRTKLQLIYDEDECFVIYNKSTTTRHEFSISLSLLRDEFMREPDDLSIKDVIHILESGKVESKKFTSYESEVVQFKNQNRNIEFLVEDGLAEATYIVTGEVLTFPTRTTPENLQNWTYANFLAMKYEREKHKKVVPLCHFKSRDETQFGV